MRRYDRAVLQRKPTDGLHLYRSPTSTESAAHVPAPVEAQIGAMRGGGQALDQQTRSFMEPQFGHDFSQVRVHTDTRATEAARTLNARAFTIGSDIAFAQGSYQPETSAGRQLLAHELTHVVQQGRAPEAVQRAEGGAMPLLRSGSRAPEVITLQQQLIGAGAAISADGMFGPQTARAVRSFQQAAGLSPDGIVGPQTWERLMSGGVSIQAPGGGQAAGAASPQNAAFAAKLQAIYAALRTLRSGQATAGSSTSAGAVHSGRVHQPVRHAGWFDDDEEQDSGSSWVEDAAGSAADWASEQVSGAQSWVEEQIDSVTSAATEAYGSTEQWVEEQVSGAQSWVEEQIDTTLEGITGPIRDVGEELGQLSDDLRERYKDEIAALERLIQQAGIGQGFSIDPAVLGQLDDILTGLQGVTANQTAGGVGASSTTISLKESSWSVKGSTIADVGQELSTHQSTHGEAGHVERGSTNISYGPPSAQNKVQQVTVEVPLTREMPVWPNAAEVGKKCPCWLKEWNRFLAALTAHEQKHVDIYKKHLTDVHKKMLGKSETDADAAIDKALEAAEKEQSEFDTSTDHGKKPAPGTAFNAGIACDSC